MEFTCTVFSSKLTGMFKVTFCMNYEKFILIVPNFREIRVTHTPQPTRTHTHTHTHTHTQNYVRVCKGIYLLFHIQFSCCPMKILSVALV